MGIQDDIYDIASDLEGEPSAQAFERVCGHIYRLEAAYSEHVGIIARIRHGYEALREVTHSPVSGLKK